MNLEEQNKEIDKIFKSIQSICTEYLSEKYPEAPDPDDFIDRIENRLRKYQKITGEIE